MNAEGRDPTLRCVHCGALITGEDYAEAQQRYTQHVTDEHDKPTNVRGARSR